MFREMNASDSLTIIIVTHEHDVANTAKRQIVMQDGKIVG